MSLTHAHRYLSYHQFKFLVLSNKKTEKSEVSYIHNEKKMIKYKEMCALCDVFAPPAPPPHDWIDQPILPR